MLPKSIILLFAIVVCCISTYYFWSFKDSPSISTSLEEAVQEVKNRPLLPSGWLALADQQRISGDQKLARSALLRAAELAENRSFYLKQIWYRQLQWKMYSDLKKTSQRLINIDISSLSEVYQSTNPIFGNKTFIEQILPKEYVNDVHSDFSYLSILLAYLAKTQQLKQAFELWSEVPDNLNHELYMNGDLAKLSNYFFLRKKYSYARTITLSINGKKLLLDDQILVPIKPSDTSSPFCWKIESRAPIKIDQTSSAKTIIVSSEPILRGQAYRLSCYLALDNEDRPRTSSQFFLNWYRNGSAIDRLTFQVEQFAQNSLIPVKQKGTYTNSEIQAPIEKKIDIAPTTDAIRISIGFYFSNPDNNAELELMPLVLNTNLKDSAPLAPNTNNILGQSI